MRTSLAGRPGAAGLACRLLLALALAACGGGDDAGEGARADSAAVDPGAAVTAAAAADTCTGPPPAYAQPVLTGPWAGLLAALAADGVTFPDITGNDDTTAVKLCRNCGTVPVEIRASNKTPCLRPEDLNGQAQRITGMFIVLETFPAQQGWDTLQAGDSVFVFARGNGPATLVYDHGGSGKTAPSTAWQFWYCRDGHTGGRTPQAQWRPRGTPPTTGPGKGKGEVGEGDGGGSYGWMACASGCCQFYTPPPNELMQTTPPQANANAPDTVGGGPSYGRPYWCPAR
jgi:hypothetical protein